MKELHFEGTDLDRIASLDRVQCGFARPSIVARQLDFDQTASQACCIDRCRDIMQDMVNRSNMVFMSMCNDNPHDFIGFLTQILIVGNDVVYSEHVIAGEHDACIHDHNLVVELVGGHVLAHFPKSTQGNNLQFSVLTHTSMFILTSLQKYIYPPMAVKVIKKDPR